MTICPLLITSPAHVSWVSHGLQPALQELQTQGKGYWASQGHKLAWSVGAVASSLGAGCSKHPPRGHSEKPDLWESGSPKSFRAVFLPASGWARGTSQPSPLGLCKEEQLGKQRSASLPPNGKANCYHLVRSINMMGSWIAIQGDINSLKNGGACGGWWLASSHPPAIKVRSH